MMLGTAASNSMVVATGRLSQGGQSWVRKIAMPSDTGTPITSAMSAVVRVPTTATHAPYWSRCTSQTLDVMKPSPNSRKAGSPP